MTTTKPVREGGLREEEVKLVAWTDGGGDCSPDTEAYIGVLVTDESGETLWKHGEGIGKATHNVAEYRAVLEAIRYAVEAGATQLLVKSDSRVVVNQINGGFRVTKPHLAEPLEQVRRATEDTLEFQIEWIPRKENKAADALTWTVRPPGARSAAPDNID
jgi:ribonuclease HI